MNVEESNSLKEFCQLKKGIRGSKEHLIIGIERICLQVLCNGVSVDPYGFYKKVKQKPDLFYLII